MSFRKNSALQDYSQEYESYKPLFQVYSTILSSYIDQLPKQAVLPGFDIPDNFYHSYQEIQGRIPSSPVNIAREAVSAQNLQQNEQNMEQNQKQCDDDNASVVSSHAQEQEQDYMICQSFCPQYQNRQISQDYCPEDRDEERQDGYQESIGIQQQKQSVQIQCLQQDEVEAQSEEQVSSVTENRQRNHKKVGGMEHVRPLFPKQQIDKIRKNRLQTFCPILLKLLRKKILDQCSKKCHKLCRNNMQHIKTRKLIQQLKKPSWTLLQKLYLNQQLCPYFAQIYCQKVIFHQKITMSNVQNISHKKIYTKYLEELRFHFIKITIKKS